MEFNRFEEFKDFQIPDYCLVPDLNVVETESHVPSCPVIVFVNGKSGGQLGTELLGTFKALLNTKQVNDLGERTPDDVLRQVYAILQSLKSKGDKLATIIEDRLKIIVAGGDGTIGWLLGVISDLKLPKAPPVVPIPLGTGNNLHFSFGWGKKNPGTDTASVKSCLEVVRNAHEMNVDSWHIIMRMMPEKGSSCDPVAPLELPHSLHAFKRVSQSDELNMEGRLTFRGGFWNYFSMGMDAQVSYAFHAERKLNPEKFKSQVMNQKAYLKLASSQGMLFPSFSNSSLRDIGSLAKVKIMKRHGDWEDLILPPKIRSIVCLNLPSFSGGFNPWGNPSGRKARRRNLKPPYVDDGLLEVVGFRNFWHGLALFSSKGHATRLAQATRIRFEFHKGAADHIFMRIDGEPWKQPLPTDDDTVSVEISCRGQVKMLANRPCASKSLDDGGLEGAHHEAVDNIKEEDGEERRKFGAAETFKVPDPIDLS